MGIVYGFVWAVWWWRITSPSLQANSLRTPENTIPTDHAGLLALRERGIEDMRQNALAHGVPAQVPVDIVQAGTAVHAGAANVILHQWNGLVPCWSLCKVNEGMYVCSPELSFLQVVVSIRRIVREKLAPWQYIVVLAELGCELCGTYVKQNTPRGYKNRTVTLCNKGSLAVFAGRVAHEKGAARLQEVLTWVLDNLHSPMETTLYLLLCLPARMGGMALPQPYANFSLEVPRRLWGKTERRHIVPDLFWPEFGLIGEYDSSEVHVGRELRDQERVELAQDMGYRVVTFRAGDMRDRRRFLEKVKSLAHYMGREVPLGDRRLEELQVKLQHMLIVHERWI